MSTVMILYLVILQEVRLVVVQKLSMYLLEMYVATELSMKRVRPVVTAKLDIILDRQYVVMGWYMMEWIAVVMGTRTTRLHKGVAVTRCIDMIVKCVAIDKSMKLDRRLSFVVGVGRMILILMRVVMDKHTRE